MWTYDYIYNDEDQAEQMLRTWMQAKQTRMLFSNQFFFLFVFFCIHVPWMTNFQKERKETYFFHDSNNILWVLYNWQLLALGRLWIPTLLIMTNTRCQSWMSDEHWEDGPDECAMRGLFVFWPGNCVKTHNLQNPSETICPTDYMFIKAH